MVQMRILQQIGKLILQQKHIQKQQLTQLSEIELKYLITLIGRSEFKGSDLQLVYSITAKLQNQLKK